MSKICLFSLFEERPTRKTERQILKTFIKRQKQRVNNIMSNYIYIVPMIDGKRSMSLLLFVVIFRSNLDAIWVDNVVVVVVLVN